MVAGAAAPECLRPTASHVPTASTRIAPATAPACDTRVQRGAAVARDVRRPPAGAPGAASASANRAVVRYRSAGTFASARRIAPSTVSGMVARTIDGGDTWSSECRAMIACAVGPVNGGSPTSISYVTHARLYSSLRPSISAFPVACSGLMYAGVPMTVPVWVSGRPSPAALNARAMPKSATTALPPDSMMFSGLMSRCTTPWLCA